MKFYQTNRINNLGLKTVAWVEHDIDNQVPSEFIEPLRKQCYEIVQSKRHEIERTISGYHGLRKRIGRSVRRFPPSPDSLYGQFERKSELASVSVAVDIYNLISLVTGLSIGGHDLKAVTGDVRLDLTEGTEIFKALGSNDSRVLPANEYAYLDSRDNVLCRMEYRQSALTAINSDSRDCLFIIQGHDRVELQQLQRAADSIREHLSNFCGSRQGETWEYSGGCS